MRHRYSVQLSDKVPEVACYRPDRLAGHWWVCVRSSRSGWAEYHTIQGRYVEVTEMKGGGNVTPQARTSAFRIALNAGPVLYNSKLAPAARTTFNAVSYSAAVKRL